MTCKVPGPTCRETRPVNTKDGTSVLCPSPRPGPNRGPEQVSDEIGASYMPVGSRLCLDGAQMQVLAALRSRREEIIAAEKTFRVDRRAIAGAIAWEMLENPPTRLRRVARAVAQRSVGWGKVHLFNFSKSGALLGVLTNDPARALDFHTIAKETEDAGYLPKLSFNDRKNMLATPEGAIKYIAGIMAATADLAGRYGFDDIRSDPVILTQVFQGETLKTWEEKLSKKPKGTPFIAGNDMAIWVGRNLAFLADAVGTPTLPESDPARLVCSSAEDKIIEVVKGSTLSDIAQSQYGDWRLWPLIYDANRPNIGSNPNRISPGLRLSVAALTRYSDEQVADARRRAPSWRDHK